VTNTWASRDKQQEHQEEQEDEDLLISGFVVGHGRAAQQQLFFESLLTFL
jgi:hypothetical protein